MGEWSEFFDDFPEENPGNYDESGRFDPNGTLRQERSQQKLANKKLDEVLAKKGQLRQPPKAK